MSKPILIPRDLRLFRHPHKVPPGYVCETVRPIIELDTRLHLLDQGERVISVVLDCGEIVDWEL